MFLISLTSITLTGCGRSPEQRLEDAGTKAGQARNTAVKVALPSICAQAVPHVTAKVGMQAIAHDKLEHHQLDVANARLLGCAATANKLLAAAQTVAGPAK